MIDIKTNESFPSTPDWHAFSGACEAVLDSENVFKDYARRFAYGTDASFYRFVPRLVVRVPSERQLISLLQLARLHSVSLTFRAAGTSLSGQAVTDSVLVLTGEGWNGIHVGDKAETVDVQVGAIGAHVNRILARWGRKIGPDPASLDSCKIGGIVANNASGMCCGTVHNSYETMTGIRLVLADGTSLDTRDSESVRNFRKSHKRFLEQLAIFAARVRDEPALAQTIRHKYRLKNTTGYSLNAFIDFEDPIDILAHLMVGSEGTLGFISEVTLRTIPDHQERAAALVCFKSVDECCIAINALKACPVNAVELMDHRALATIGSAVRASIGLRSFDENSEGVALLIETSAQEAKELSTKTSFISRHLEQLLSGIKVRFDSSSQGVNRLWKMRKGLFPTVGAARRPGTTVIIEDIALPLETLASGILDLQHLFVKCGYDDAIIFGHALDGNLHFVFSQSFNTIADVERYREFMDTMCHLVAKRYGGSLKAEHGTGRNIAPYVELEWGKEAYRLMQDIKALFDPNAILNPGVILNDDPKAHVKNLKRTPLAHHLIDKCTECGFCEPVCPARALTLSPRQRITLYREIQHQSRLPFDVGAVGELTEAFGWLGIDTCAATGLCEDRCPVGINTGSLINALREERRTGSSGIGEWACRNFNGTTAVVRSGLTIVDRAHGLLGTDAMMAMSNKLRKMTGNRIPAWIPTMPRAGRPSRLQQHEKRNSGSSLVYWPSCVARNFSPMRGGPMRSLPATVLKVLEGRGFRPAVLADNNLCCGQPFISHGYPEQARRKLTELAARLRIATGNGRIPVFTDTSPCAYRVRASGEHDLLDPIEFIHSLLSKSDSVVRVPGTAALHVTCSAQRMGLAGKALEITERLVGDVIVPQGLDCCGFAGDRGFSVPELNASSLSSLRSQVRHCRDAYSSSLTCEIGLSYHSGLSYRSLFYLVEEAASRDRSS